MSSAARTMDALVVAYYTLLHGGPAGDRVAAMVVHRNVVECAHASARLIDDTLTAAAGVAADSHDLIHTKAAAARNPSTNLDTLLDWVQAPVSGPDAGIPALMAATNSAVGPYAEDLWDQIDKRVAVGLVANHGVSEQFIAAHWRAEVETAAGHPKLPADALAELLARLGPPRSLWSNPNIDPETLEETFLGTTKGDLRRLILRNAATPIALIEACAADIDEDPVTVHAAQVALTVRRIDSAPLDTPVAHLDRIRFHPAVGAALVDADAATGGAVTALYRAGFSGTVAELVAVAGSVTT